MKKMMVAAGCLALAWTVGAAVEVCELSVSPRTDGSGLADISLKVTSDIGNTNLLLDIAAYTTDRATLFTDGDISLDGGATFTQDVLVPFPTAGATKDVALVWNWKRHNPDLNYTDVSAPVTLEVVGKLQEEDVVVKCKNGRFIGVRDSLSGVISFKSIPYAKPPTRETGLRWKPPVEPDDSDAVYSARHSGPAAAQTREPEHASHGPVSENCLRLSIWTADGFSAIEVKDGEAKLDVVIGRSDSLEESAEWTSVSTNEVSVPAPGEQGFFIVVPASLSDRIVVTPPKPIR